jgi:hypothetical protein
MQLRNTLVVGFTSIVLAGSLAVGATAFATGSGDGDGTGAGNGRSQLTTEQKCAKADELIAKAPELQQRISERIATLEDKRAAADAAGETAKVERLDNRLARLGRIADRIEARLTRVTTWAEGHCD